MGVSCTPTESSTFNTVVNSGDAFSFQYRLVRDKPLADSKKLVDPPQYKSKS